MREIARFTVPGAPRQKKNSGQIVFVGARCIKCKRGKVPLIIPSKAWKKWQKHAELNKADWAPQWALCEPMNVRATFYLDTLRAVDACNLYEGLADVLESTGVVANDRQFVSWSGSKLDLDRKNPRTEVVLELVDEVSP